MSNLKIKVWIITRVIRAINRILPSDTSEEQYRKLFPRFLEKTNNIPDANVLEIGSRNEAGHVQKGRFTSAKEYVGFDYYPGGNVDVVGDAHKLSRYLPHEHFDAVYSNSVFEHLAMPWKVVLEMNKVMKTGGLVFINTHPAYPPHNRPWDFWRFQESSFSTLLNAKTGFRIIDCENGEPASLVLYGKAMFKARPSLSKRLVSLGICVIAEKIGPPAAGLSWDVDVEDCLDGAYPAPNK